VQVCCGTSVGNEEVRVIEDVGAFRTKFQGLRFLEFEYPRQARIDRPAARTDDRAWSHVAEITQRRCCECGGAEPQAAETAGFSQVVGALAAVGLRGYLIRILRERILAVQSAIGTADHGERASGSNAEHPGQPPVTG